MSGSIKELNDTVKWASGTSCENEIYHLKYIKVYGFTGTIAGNGGCAGNSF